MIRTFEALEALEAGITQLRSSSRRRSSSSRRPSLSPWPAAPRIDLSALDVNSITSSPKVSRLRPRSHSVSTNRPHSPDSRAHGPSRAPLTFTHASACFRSTGTISSVLWRCATTDVLHRLEQGGVCAARLLGGRMWACLVGFGRSLALCLPTRRAATAGANFSAC